MKSVIMIFVFPLLFFTNNAFAQPDTRVQNILTHYLHIKNALVKDDAIQAAVAAQGFIKNLNGISYQQISEGNVNALLKDAGVISNSTDLNMQRKVFNNFSDNITILAKKLPLSENDLFIQYCPMKKASWISDTKEIKNPYYGSSMLTCGNIKETIN